jgi:hypothetical protein
MHNFLTFLLIYRLVDKDLEDSNFTGIEHIIKCLTRQGNYV